MFKVYVRVSTTRDDKGFVGKLVCNKFYRLKKPYALTYSDSYEYSDCISLVNDIPISDTYKLEEINDVNIKLAIEYYRSLDRVHKVIRFLKDY